MRKFISKHLNKDDKLIKHSLVVFAATIAAGVCNYIFQLYMGRALGPEEYGVLGALFSMFYALNVPSGTVQTVVTKFVSEYKAMNEYGKITGFFIGALKRITLYGLVFLVVFMVVSGLIASFLKIPQGPVIAMGFVLFLSFISPLFTGVLRGLQRFRWFGAVSILQSALKLGFGIAFVSLGFGVMGAVNSLNLSILISMAIALIPVWFLFSQPKDPVEHLEVFRYGFFVLAGTMALMFITNIDMFLVKHFFSAAEAGYYAAASMLAKIPWFASGALAAVMFPKISELHTRKEDSSAILKSTVFYTALISFSVVLVYFVAPTFVTRMLYGSEYLAVKDIIGYLSLGLGFFALNTVLAMYNFAVKRTGFVYMILCFLAVEFLLILFVHSTLLEVVKIVAVTNIALFFYLMFYTRKEFGITNGITP